ncbi:MAG: glycoside hydrolase family 25 protein, partial [Oscillospiraceae bacterium]|nr:glycoside hydrolase family 25 protein [Oscillospiraceae bacterium]
MLCKGIDVSRHQGNIDWKKVRNSGKVDFAILRAGYGKVISQKDSKFEEYYAQCNANQIPVGTYWYSYAMSEWEARQEAEVFLQVIQGKQFAYPVYFDLEEPKQFALGKTKCSSIAKAFLETVENAGYFVGLYMSKSALESYITEEIRNRYAVWVAHYGVNKTSYAGQFGMWQKSDTGSVSGISGNVDLDECYQDYPALIQNAGLNGFVKSEPVKPDEMPEPATKQQKYFSVSVDGKTYSGTLV